MLCVILLGSSIAQAQESAQPIPEQEVLIRKGVQTSNEGRYEEALRFYRAALALGDLNIIHLNMGRAHQKMGHCFQAREDYQHALEAPQVAVPAPEQVKQAIGRYRQEMPQGCLAALVPRCDPGVNARIKPDTALRCGERTLLEPGQYTVLLQQGERRHERTVTLKPLEEQTLQASLPLLPRDTPVIKEAEQRVSGSEVAGWALVSSGGALLLGGLWMSYQVNSTNREIEDLALELERGQGDPARVDGLIQEGEQAQLLQYLGLGLGAAALTTGTILLLWEDAQEPEASAALTPWFTPEGAGATWRVNY